MQSNAYKKVKLLSVVGGDTAYNPRATFTGPKAGYLRREMALPAAVKNMVVLFALQRHYTLRSGREP